VNKKHKRIKELVDDDTTLTLFIATSCELKCRMCAIPYKTVTRLSEAEWLDIVKQACVLGIRHFVISGGEPLYDGIALKVLKELSRQKSYNAFRLGVTTNGIAIGLQPEILEGISPSYIDVSIDGTAKTHNSLRGPGAYQRSLRGLQVCLRRFGQEAVYVCSIIVPGCLNDIPNAIESLTRLGVRNILLQPPLLTGRGLGKTSLLPNAAELSTLIKVLLKKDLCALSQRIRVRIWLYPSLVQQLYSILGLVRESIRCMNKGKRLVFRGKKLDLMIDAEESCTAYEGNIMISSDGSVAGCCVDFTGAQIKKEPLDNIRDKPFKDIRSFTTSFDPCGRFNRRKEEGRDGKKSFEKESEEGQEGKESKKSKESYCGQRRFRARFQEGNYN